MAFGFSLTHKTKPIKKAWEGLGATGTDTFNAGNALADTEVNTLRGYRADYQDRLANPLGTGPNSATGIFNRARGALSDTATQRAGAFSSRLLQRSVQDGGNLSPEARAQLEQQNQRDINQQLFEGNNAISDAQAAMTLTETSKLFDRMEGISKTILGVGIDRSNVGLNALIQSILGRQALEFGKVAAATNMVGTAASAGIGASGANTNANAGGSTNPYAGGKP